jgi:hypothetical protein
MRCATLIRILIMLLVSLLRVVVFFDGLAVWVFFADDFLLAVDLQCNSNGGGGGYQGQAGQGRSGSSAGSASAYNGNGNANSNGNGNGNGNGGGFWSPWGSSGRWR